MGIENKEFGALTKIANSLCLTIEKDKMEAKEKFMMQFLGG